MNKQITLSFVSPEDLMMEMPEGEAPIGSTEENVEDDIPAMLSEGEYVIPAHVVNYYGIKTFEDMISSAEIALMLVRTGEVMDEDDEEEPEDDTSDEEDDD